jgi:hypothetical protein
MWLISGRSRIQTQNKAPWEPGTELSTILPPQGPVLCTFFFFFLVVLGMEPRAMHAKQALHSRPSPFTP